MVVIVLLKPNNNNIFNSIESIEYLESLDDSPNWLKFQTITLTFLKKLSIKILWNKHSENYYYERLVWLLLNQNLEL